MYQCKRNIIDIYIIVYNVQVDLQSIIIIFNVSKYRLANRNYLISYFVNDGY